MWTHISRACRSLVKHPLSYAAAILGLSLALAANIAAFAALDAVLLRPLPVTRPDRLINIGTTNAAGVAGGITFHQFRQIAQQNASLSAVVAWYGDRLSNVEVQGRFARASNWFVSDDYFTQLEATAVVGRLLGAADVNVMAVKPEAVAVVGYDFWQRHWAGDPRVIGEIVKIEGVPFTIVGVAPKHLTGFSVTTEADLTVPLTARPILEARAPETLLENASMTLNVVGRVRDDVAIDAARAELTTRWPEILRASLPANLPPAVKNGFLATPLAITSAETGIDRVVRQRFGSSLQIIMALAVLVLLLGSANIAGLMLTRTAVRRGEFAVLQALGAGARQIVMLVVTDAIVLVGAAALVSVPLAYWMVRAMAAFMFTDFIMPVALDFSASARTLAFLAGIIALSCSILIVVSLAWLRSARLTSAMAAHGSRSASAPHVSGAVLAALQVAVAVAVLGVGTVLIRSMASLDALPLGYTSDNVTVIQPYPRPGAYRALHDDTYDRELVARAAAVPGVTGAAVASLNPMGTSAPLQQVQAIGEGAEVAASFSSVSPGLFGVLQIPLVEGRDIAWSDDTQSTRVAIVSRTLASRLFGDRPAIGRRIRIGTQRARQSVEIVGVVADSRLYDVHRTDAASVYVAHVQEADLGRWKTLVVQTAGNIDLQQPMRAAIDSLGHEYLLYSRTLAYQMALNHKEGVLAGRVAAAFGLMALIVAGLGVFGCLAFSVSTRTKEIAVRVALGARPAAVLSFIGRDVALVCGAGALIGVAGALSGQRVVQALLYDGAPADATSTLIAVVLLTVTAIGAAAIPAMRVLKLDPARTLRDG